MTSEQYNDFRAVQYTVNTLPIFRPCCRGGGGGVGGLGMDWEGILHTFYLQSMIWSTWKRKDRIYLSEEIDSLLVV